MESTEVILNGKTTTLPVLPMVTCFLHCYLNFKEDGYTNMEKEWGGTGGEQCCEHPAIRMATFHKAIEYVEGVIAKLRKSIAEEGSDLGTDVENYFYITKVAPYSRSAFIAWFEKQLIEIRQKQANFIRMEQSYYPPIWLMLLRRRRLQQQLALEASVPKSDYLSRDPDSLLSLLLASPSNEEASRSYHNQSTV
jgi:hypothetical protein